MKLRRVKALLLGCMFLVMTGLLVAQNFDLEGLFYSGIGPSPLDIKFLKNNKVHLHWTTTGRDDYHKEYTYKEKHIGQIPVFVLDSKLPKNLFSLFEDSKSKFNPTNKFILLTGLTKWVSSDKPVAIGLVMFLDQKTKHRNEYFIRYPRPATCEPIVAGFQSKTASSFLTENKKEYKIENLENLAPDTPWIEGVPGWGIGENFTFMTDCNYLYGKYLVIMNGYISTKNPNLYHENGRVKKIKITGLSNGKEKVFTIKDTPHPQSIDLSFLSSAQKVKITILDVYKGTKYQDTCLHSILSYGNEVIPYED